MAHFDSDIMDDISIVAVIKITSPGFCKGETEFERFYDRSDVRLTKR